MKQQFAAVLGKIQEVLCTLTCMLHTHPHINKSLIIHSFCDTLVACLLVVGSDTDR